MGAGQTPASFAAVRLSWVANESDVDASRHQRLGQQARHQLPAVMAQQHAPGGNQHQHGDARADCPSLLSASEDRAVVGPDGRHLLDLPAVDSGRAAGNG